MRSNSVPRDRIQIFDRQGIALVEFRATVERSWAIGEEGRAQFTYPSRKTNVVNEAFLQFGNWLYIQNDSLPDWIGVIDIPRKWKTRDVTISAYTPEHLFGQRIGPKELTLTGSAGSLFRKLIQYINAEEATILQEGEIWAGGPQREETLNPTRLSEDLQRIVERSNEEYDWRPVTDANGRLVVYGDWVNQLGENTSIILQEGSGGGNIEGVTGDVLVEDGPIVNSLLAYGDGATWKDKPTATVENMDSVGKYGLRQDSQEFSGVSSATALQANGRSSIAQTAEPLKTLQLNALNVGQTFQYLKLGNQFIARFQHIGFYNGSLGYETNVRIIGMLYDPQVRNKVELTVEVV